MFTMLAASKMNGGRDRLHELSGTPPLSFKSKGKPLTAWSITGNGTPTPDTPQEVKAVGDRTGNLFDASNTLNNARIGAVGEVVSDNACVLSDYIPVLPNESYSQSARFSYSNALAEFDENKEFIGRYISGNGTITTSENTRFIRVSCTKTLVDSFMLNFGTEPLLHEPYGYKIPVVTRGKNLLKLKEVNLTVQGIAISIKNNSITVKGTAKASGGRTAYLSGNFVLQSGTYFISGDIVNGMVYCLTDRSNGKAVIASSTSKFTLTEKTEVAFGLNFINGVSYDATVSVMLNEGNKILPYEPYHEPITTLIYLPTPLYSGEVMRSDGTITRSDGTTETFTAPQIPTLNGTTVIDVDTAVKPESMTIKYRR